MKFTDDPRHAKLQDILLKFQRAVLHRGKEFKENSEELQKWTLYMKMELRRLEDFDETNRIIGQDIREFLDKLKVKLN